MVEERDIGSPRRPQAEIDRARDAAVVPRPQHPDPRIEPGNAGPLRAREFGRGGVRSKFGLFVSEVIDALDYLRKNDMGDCLNLLHFHLGSQINNIRNIKGAITELIAATSQSRLVL